MDQQRFATGRRVVGAVVLALVAGVLGVGPAAAAPPSALSAAPAPVRNLLAQAERAAAKHAPTAARRTFRLPGDDEGAYVAVDPGCASGRKKVRPRAVVYTGSKVKLDWVLTGAGVRKKGTVKTKADWPVKLKLPSVRAGAYRLTLARHRSPDVLVEEMFDVLPCVVVTTSCRAVTFTNPAGNPPAYVTYRGHKKKQTFDLELAPGATRTVRADYSKVDHDAVVDDPEGSGGSVGAGTVKVKQKCAHGPAQPADNALQSSGFAACSGAGAPATVVLEWAAQPSLTQLRYEVLSADQQVVAEGTIKGGRDADVSLPAGTYTYRSHANGIEQPFEELTFTVLRCVEVTPGCRAITVHNPNPEAVLVVAYTTDDDDTEVPGDGDLTDLPADGSVTIPWTGADAWVLALGQGALSGGGSDFFSLASSLSAQGEPVTTHVPQDC